jgi:hypothetical protein
MAHQPPPPDEDSDAIDSRFVLTSVRILIVQALVIGGLYWMSRYFA